MLTFIELVWIFIINIIALSAIGFIGWIIIKREINSTIGAVIDSFTEVFMDPQVKRSMSILGKESGRIRAEKVTTDAIATQVLNNPNIQGWKMIAKSALGIDLDEMIEEHGAVETLAALKQIGDTIGINIPDLIIQGTKGLNTTTDSGKTTGQYLKG